MKFFYPEIETETYEGQRWYLTPAGPMASITTILGNTEPREKVISLENWKKSVGYDEAAAISKRATDSGTNVHLLAERYLKKLRVEAPIDGQPVPAGDLAKFNALRLKLDRIDEVWGQEVALFSETLQVAGRCDLIGLYKGVPSIVDFKTSSKIKQRADIRSYELQLLFYATAHNEMFGTEIKTGVILMTADSGFPLEFSVDLTENTLIGELRSRIDLFYEVQTAEVVRRPSSNK